MLWDMRRAFLAPRGAAFKYWALSLSAKPLLDPRPEDTAEGTVKLARSQSFLPQTLKLGKCLADS